MRIRLILTNTALVALGLLVAQLPGLTQGQRAPAQKTTTESGWYKYGQPIPDLKGPAPKLANGARVIPVSSDRGTSGTFTFRTTGLRRASSSQFTACCATQEAVSQLSGSRLDIETASAPTP